MKRALFALVVGAVIVYYADRIDRRAAFARTLREIRELPA